MGFLLTDGGPEHNLMFLSVQIGLIIMFRMLEFDQLIVGRSCPQNRTNEVERVISNLNYALYSMCFTRLPMREPPRASHSVNANEDSEESKTEWLEQRWRSSNSLSMLRERLEDNLDFHDAAMQSVGDACEEMTLRFDNLVWAENELKRGYIANGTQLREFVDSLSTIDPAIGEYTSGNYKKSDVFTSNKIKEMHKKTNSINDYISTVIRLRTLFRLKQSVGKIQLLRKLQQKGTLTLSLVKYVHLVAEGLKCYFLMAEFMPCPDKDILNTSETSDYLSYTEAMSHIRNGKNNVGDKYVPSYCVVEPKMKWAAPPVNTKGTPHFTIRFPCCFKFSNLILRSLHKY